MYVCMYVHSILHIVVQRVVLLLAFPSIVVKFNAHARKSHGICLPGWLPACRLCTKIVVYAARNGAHTHTHTRTQMQFIIVINYLQSLP